MNHFTKLELVTLEAGCMLMILDVLDRYPHLMGQLTPELFLEALNLGNRALAAQQELAKDPAFKSVKALPSYLELLRKLDAMASEA